MFFFYRKSYTCFVSKVPRYRNQQWQNGSRYIQIILFGVLHSVAFLVDMLFCGHTFWWIYLLVDIPSGRNTS